MDFNIIYGRNRKGLITLFEKMATVTILSCLLLMTATMTGVAMKTSIYFLRDETGFVRYVGKTSQPLERRLAGHINCARRGERTHKGNGIRSILQQGFSPTIDLITEVDGDGNGSEIVYIKWLRSKGIELWNGTEGGEGTTGGHWTLSKETKRKMGRAQKNKKVSEQTRQKISLANKGKQRSIEVKLKLSSIHKKHCNTKEWKDFVSGIFKGKPWSEARRKAQAFVVFPKRGPYPESGKQKRRETMKANGYKASEETKRKISLAMKGKKFSDIHRLHISQAKKLYNHNA